MFRVLFLILILMTLSTFAQIDKKPEARKIDEIGNVVIEAFEIRIEFLLTELEKEPTAHGYIINYGSIKEISRNESIIKNWSLTYKADISRINVVRGGFLNQRKTQFWIIPAGAELPELIPTAYKTEEFEKATNGYVKMQFDNFMVKLQAEPNAQGYIINYGSEKEIRMREKQIQNAIAFRKFDQSRITIVRGGNSGKLKTQFWLVPAGAENPTP